MADTTPKTPKTPKPKGKSVAVELAPTHEGEAAKVVPEAEAREEIEEVVGDVDDEGVDDDLDLDDSFDGALFDPMHQLTQLLVTESGTPLVDVLQGIQDALDKQNKILYKLVSVVDTKL